MFVKVVHDRFAIIFPSLLDLSVEHIKFVNDFVFAPIECLEDGVDYLIVVYWFQVLNVGVCK